MTAWTLADARAAVEAWDCPEDMRVLLLPASEGMRPTLVLVNAANCPISVALDTAAPLDELAVSLDWLVHRMRRVHGRCTYPRSLRRTLAYAAVRFEVAIAKAAWRQAWRAVRWRVRASR